MPDINGTNKQDLQIRRGDTLEILAYRLGDLSAIDDMWFTLKRRLADTDTESQIQISLDAGLLAIDGAAATVAANGSITITNAAVGNLTIELAAEESAKLDGGYVGYWDIQTLTGDVVATTVYGNAMVIGDATRRIV